MCSRLPSVSKCCCFISLRVGAYLIGLLQTLFGLAFIISAVTIPLMETQSDDLDDADKQHRNTSCYIFGSLFLILGVTLMLGVKIKHFLLIKVYTALEIIGLFVGLVIYLIILINLFLSFVVASHDTWDTTDFVGHLIKIFSISTAPVLVVVIVIVFAIIALKVYFLLCVNSYLKELGKQQRGTPHAVGYTAVAQIDDNNIKV